MKKLFVDSVAETREDFFELVRSCRLTFYEVYDGTPNDAIEQILIDRTSDELLLRFDMKLHTPQGRARFCSLNDLEKKCYGFPQNFLGMPLPYYSTYLLGYGRVDVAWTLAEVERLIIQSQQEKKIVEEIHAKSN